MGLIDADALEREGWHMSRTVRVDKDTMEFQTRKPTDFPTIEPQRMKGKWIHKWSGDGSVWMEQRCSECGCIKEDEPVDYNFCPNCGADMRGTE